MQCRMRANLYSVTGVDPGADFGTQGMLTAHASRHGDVQEAEAAGRAGISPYYYLTELTVNDAALPEAGGHNDYIAFLRTSVKSQLHMRALRVALAKEKWPQLIEVFQEKCELSHAHQSRSTSELCCPGKMILPVATHRCCGSERKYCRASKVLRMCAEAVARASPCIGRCRELAKESAKEAKAAKKATKAAASASVTAAADNTTPTASPSVRGPHTPSQHTAAGGRAATATPPSVAKPVRAPPSGGAKAAPRKAAERARAKTQGKNDSRAIDEDFLLKQTLVGSQDNEASTSQRTHDSAALPGSQTQSDTGSGSQGRRRKGLLASLPAGNVGMLPPKWENMQTAVPAADLFRRPEQSARAGRTAASAPPARHSCGRADGSTARSEPGDASARAQAQHRGLHPNAEHHANHACPVADMGSQDMHALATAAGSAGAGSAHEPQRRTASTLSKPKAADEAIVDFTADDSGDESRNKRVR